ncbi:MAG: glycoside hydrolase family 2 TIM barrel-domain containing protein [Bacteroidales bacterium]|nr:glycoside hydrolase family 2 TIM barrel-domain containing protein [Bacteroidales bacterium]
MHSLNGVWTFSTDSASLAKGRSVEVPHTWNTEKDLQEYYGEGWYCRNFEIPSSWKGKRIEIQFDAVYHDAWVYVNGQLAGEHIGSGYNRFWIDITKWIHQGKNQLVVKVSNAFSRNNIPFTNSFDWNNDGGIIRDVHILATNQAAIRRVMVNGKPDLKTGKSGTANIAIEMTEPYDNSKFEGEIKEWKTGKSIWKGELKEKNSIFLNDILFWHFDSPNLYSLTVDVFHNGVLSDKYTTRFGFREIGVSPTHFILNGEPVRLMGVEWMPGSSIKNGMAETKDELIQNLKLMKNANCIYSRFHWQQDQAVYNWCDENGILYQEEIPCWGPATEFTDTLITLGKTHLDEMIKDRYNHPCIIAWGIGNELRSADEDVLKGLKEWNQHARDLDSTRLILYVSNRINQHKKDNPGMPDDAGYTLSDAILFNEYYSTWYGQSVSAVPAALDKIHNDYPDKALIISEWGICEPDHKGGDPRRVKEMVEQIDIYGKKPYVAGAIYFSINDYRTHIGKEFGIQSKRVHGTYDVEMNLKPSYSVLKAISAPIENIQVRNNNGKKELRLSGKTGIPSYTLHNYKVVYGNQEQIIKELKPGETITLSFDINNEDDSFSIYRPTGFEVLNIKE